MKKVEVLQRVLYCNIHWMEVHSLKMDKAQNNVFEKNKVDKGPHRLFHGLIHLDMKMKESTESKMVIHDKVDDHKSLFCSRCHFDRLRLVKVNVASCRDTMSPSGNSRKKVFGVIGMENEKAKVLVSYND
jgi:hypothetical protein